MKQNAEKIITPADSSKFSVHSLVQIITLDEVDILVTDSGADAEIIAGLRARGIDVHVVAENDNE